MKGRRLASLPLEVAPSTLHYWLEGKTGRAGKVHRPSSGKTPKGPALR